MLSNGQLETLKQISKIRALNPAEVERLIDQTIAQQETITNWYGLLQLISRSGSSWADRIRETLDTYHFGTTDADTIAATKELLKKHQGSSVETVLQMLDRMDAPIKRNTR